MTDTLDVVKNAMNDDAVAVAELVDALLKDRILDKLADKQQEIMQKIYGDDQDPDEVVIDIPDDDLSLPEVDKSETE
jgi:hypothetical protein